MFISYAQNFEDVILNRVFSDKKTGFYIDVGAQHPIFDSVTKAFYDRGWRGINVEPVQEYYQLLKQERERDINLNFGLGEHESELEFFELEGTGLSTFDRTTAERLSQAEGHKINTYQVPIVKLADICYQHVNCQIDFLKIDVEGWEEQVILGHDWKHFRPTIIIIEATIPNSPVRAETNINDILKGQNYHQVYFDGLNDYYLAVERSDLEKYFVNPPNVFDKFTSFHLINLQAHSQNLEKIITEKDAHSQNLEKIITEKDSYIQEQKQILKEQDRQNHILINRLKDEKFEIQRLTRMLTQLQHNQQESGERLNKQIADLQARLAVTNELITAMETSKFWKMRSAWFDLKNNLGIND